MSVVPSAIVCAWLSSGMAVLSAKLGVKKLNKVLVIDDHDELEYLLGRYGEKFRRTSTVSKL
jgi:hypothetical protein